MTPGDATWTRSRAIYWWLKIVGPQKPMQISRGLGLNTGSMDSAIRSCDYHGFLLYEEDDGRVGAWRVVDGR